MTQPQGTDLELADGYDDEEDDDEEEEGQDDDGTVSGADLVRPVRAEAKVFEIAFEDADTKPFALVFKNTTKGTTERHDFEALADTGAGGMLAVSSLIRYDPRGRQLVDLNAMLTFFERVLVEGDFDRLRELIDRRDLIISMDQLSEVFNWLLEGYTGRPTPPSSASATSRQARGRSSRVRRR